MVMENDMSAYRVKYLEGETVRTERDLIVIAENFAQAATLANAYLVKKGLRERMKLIEHMPVVAVVME